MTSMGMAVRRCYPTLTVMLCLTILPSTGCAPGRGPDAQAVDAAIAALPGVASSDFEYESGWPRGEERFNLTAVLRENATPDQARALGKTFADRVTEAGFSGIDVALTVKYRVVDRMNQVPLTSVATVAFDRRSRDAVAPELGEWLSIAQSPGVQSTTLRQPEGAVGITIEQSAKDAELRALLSAHPDLDRAEWIVAGGSIAETSIYAPGYPEVYRVKGMIPDATLRELWTRIVAEVGATGQITAETDLSRSDIRTTVDLNFPTSRDNEQGIAQAWMALPLVEKLPPPVKVDFDGAVFVMGGCSPADAGRAAPALEAELRQKYEKC